MNDNDSAMRRITVAARVAVVLLGATLGVALLEASVRFLELAVPLATQYGDAVPDPLIGYKRGPGSTAHGRSETDEFDYEYRHNSLGFRDDEHSIDKPPGVFRIVALGDSFTYGVGANFADTFPARVDRLLNQRPGQHPRIEVINLALPRQFPLVERMTLERYGLPFAPDLVLVGILPNDVLDTREGLDAICTEGGFLISCAAARWGRVPLWLYVHSHLARVLLPWLSTHLAHLQSRDYLRDGSAYEADWQSLERELERMGQVAEQHGAAFAVVSIPQGPPWRQADEYPDTRLRRWSVRSGVLFIPTLAALRAASTGTLLYWKRDGHCTPAGYAIIADVIAGALTEHGIVP